MTPEQAIERPLADYPVWRWYAGIETPIGEASRREARAAFANFMAGRAERTQLVGSTIRRHAGFRPSADEAGVGAIDAWVWPWLAQLIREGRVEPEQHSAFLHDVGVFVGEALIAERGDVGWELLTRGGKRMHGFHTPVVARFPEPFSPYWAVPLETIEDGYFLGNTVVNPAAGPFDPRLLFRYRLFVGREPWPSARLSSQALRARPSP